jgi:membrane protease YdiL (CAAX protease family)
MFMDLATTLDAESPQLPQTVRRPRWGPWATLGWGIPLAATAVLSQTLGAFGFVMWWRFLHPDQLITRADIATNGPLLAFSLAVSAPIVLGLLALVVRASRVSLSEYLALKWPRWRDFGIGTAALVCVLLATGVVAGLTGQETPEFMGATYNSAKMAGMLPLLIVSFVFLGPLQEELLFRGFFFRGFAPALGVWPAIALTSAAWAFTHVQYSWFFVGEIFALGMVFGWLRWRSGSTILTVALHAAVNGMALVEVAALANS